MGCCRKKELPEAEVIVGEIVQLARNLPQNLTLEEALAEYEGKWMRLQKPSLVTPRAFTMLFPLLVKGGMGDKLMGLFRNLPSTKNGINVLVPIGTVIKDVTDLRNKFLRRLPSSESIK
ncbi:pentatricopeptide repeat-containing protein of chloroplastic isoform X2 [Spatholobus suberectus]|nr:pentatricopeptide repeat-containing protein of chloroplastic isoform X2 [Spatholobus suberectus]